MFDLLQVHDSAYASAYSSLALFVLIAVVIASTLSLLPAFLAKRNSYHAKVLEYECGIVSESMTYTGKFDIRFYVVAMMFLLFECEIIFLFPWCMALRAVSPVGFGAAMAFLFMLVVVFIYELRSKALDW